MPRVPRQKSRQLDCVAVEKLYKEACDWLRDPANKKESGRPNYPALLKIEKFHQLKLQTLRHRYKGQHTDSHSAHQEQMLLSPYQEMVLVEWMTKDAREVKPWTRAELRVRVKQLTGRSPGKSWLKSFEQRHAETIHAARTSGLDPKRAQCFNPTTVHEHLMGWGAICHLYRVQANWDETGQQRGGGRKQTRRKCYCVVGDKTKKRLRDGNLELSTVHECCLSDGTMLDPGFIFQGTSTYTTAWWEGLEDRKVG